MFTWLHSGLPGLVFYPCTTHTNHTHKLPYSGITGAELVKRLKNGKYNEGMAADAARNARLWDEGMAAYTAANARL